VTTFERLVVAHTSPTYRRNTGRHNLNAALVIAATLSWLGSTCTQAWLQHSFGDTLSSMSRDLTEGRVHLLKALRLIPEAGISWPSAGGPRALLRSGAIGPSSEGHAAVAECTQESCSAPLRSRRKRSLAVPHWCPTV